MARVEAAFGCRLPLASLFSGGTVARQAALIDARSGSADEVLVMLRSEAASSGACLGTILLPHEVSGHVLSYAALAAHLPEGWRVAALQARGLDNTRPPIGGLPEMARTYADAVLAAGLPGPFVPVGYSFGAALAGELAAELAARGRTVARVCVIDAPANPQDFADGIVPGDEAGRLLHMVRAVEHSMGLDLGLDAAVLKQFGQETRIDLVHRRLAAIGAFGGAVTRDQVAGMLAVYGANLDALRDFRPRPIGRPVDVWVTDALAARSGLAADLGWSEVAAGPVAVHRIGGDHHSVMREPIAGELAAAIGRVLDPVPA